MDTLETSNNIDPRVLDALSQGYSKEEIDTFLANKVKKESSSLEVESAAEPVTQSKSLKDKIGLAVEQGYSLDEVKSHLITNNYNPEEFEPLLNDFKPSILDKIKKYQWDPNTQAEEVQDLSDLYKNVYGKYSTLGKQVGGVFSEDMGIEARREINALNASLATKLQEFGYDAFIEPDSGELVFKDENGVIQEVDSSFINDLYNTKAEIGGAITGAILGAKTGAKIGAGVGLAAGNATGIGLAAPEEAITVPVGAAAGTVIGAIGGGMAGAATGKALDMTVNAFQLKEDLEASLYLTQMKEAAIYDGVAGVLGAGLFKMGGYGLKKIMNAFDFVAKGNSKGAYKALIDNLHLTDEQAQEMVTAWEKHNSKIARGANKQEKAISVITNTEPGAEAFIKPVAAADPKVANSVIKEIDNRAKSLTKAIDTVSDDKVGSIVLDDLGKYTTDVKDFYGQVKQLGSEAIDGTDFRFDLDKLTIKPVMESIEKGISNPTQRERFLSYAMRINNASEGRTFTDLIDLRQAVNEFKYSKNGLKKPDVDALNKVINKIDTQINKAVKEYMPDTGKEWTKQFSLAKDAYSKMKRVEDNVLYKAITKKGATEASIRTSMKKYINALDGTFNEVMEKLPPKTRVKAEGAVIKEMTDRYTLGASADFQAIHFPNLSNTLKEFDIKTPEARHLVKTIDAFADIFKNDVQLSKVSGNIATPKFQSYLTTDPIVRVKFEVASKSFNYIKKFIPGKNANNLALMDKVEKLFQNPMNAMGADEFIKQFPKETQAELVPLVKQLQIEMAKAGTKGVNTTQDFQYMYKQSASGKFTKSDGQLGKGIYLVDKIKNPKPGANIIKKEVNMSKMATLEDISNLIGKEIDVKEIRKIPNLYKKLSDKGYIGIRVNSKAMLFED